MDLIQGHIRGDVSFFFIGKATTVVAGGIRRSLDFPEAMPVNPDLHQGTSILVTN
jgi:hypothetical protein